MPAAKLRVIAAFLVAPLAPVLLVCLFAPVEFVLLAGVVMAYGTTVFIGVPLYFAVRHFRTLTPDLCAVSGGVAGMIFILLLTAPMIFRSPSFLLAGLLLGGLLVFGFLGSVAGVAFWKVVSLGRTANEDTGEGPLPAQSAR
ncbi:MAG TPA: hypothetical protein VHA77_14535 [Xanthobacteraceae bacterium]|jgi:hypothetical protein|nr:hypothetical protein [Xanthobacteraceae bacterium]